MVSWISSSTLTFLLFHFSNRICSEFLPAMTFSMQSARMQSLREILLPMSWVERLIWRFLSDNFHSGWWSISSASHPIRFIFSRMLVQSSFLNQQVKERRLYSWSGVKSLRCLASISWEVGSRALALQSLTCLRELSLFITIIYIKSNSRQIFVEILMLVLSQFSQSFQVLQGVHQLIAAFFHFRSSGPSSTIERYMDFTFTLNVIKENGNLDTQDSRCPGQVGFSSKCTSGRL